MALNSKPTPSAAYLSECFVFDGERLFWLERPRHHFKREVTWKVWNAKHKGTEAGRPMPDGSGYVQIGLNGKRYLAHRLIAAIIGLDVSQVIDHIDGNPANNKPSNLRACSQSQNSRNRVGWIGKKTPIGVHERPNGTYTAYIRGDGKQKFLGTFKQLSQAIHARKEAEVKYYGEFTRKDSQP